MAFTAKDVKTLREMTNAGMMDCKKALQENDGDMDAAVKWLREHGIAQSAKRSGRVASDGMICVRISDDGKVGMLIEVNCETDFAARSERFQGVCKDVVDQAFAGGAQYVSASDAPADTDPALCLYSQAIPGKPHANIEEYLKELSGEIGEKIEVRRLARFEVGENGFLASYIHLGGKAGVLLEATSDKPEAAASDAVKEFCNNACLQVCSMSPGWVRPEEVSQKAIDAEKEVYKIRAKETGKPDHILDKIADGMLNKWYKEVCLLQQEYVREKGVTIQGYMDQVAKEAGAKLDIRRFARFQLGEGAEPAEGE